MLAPNEVASRVLEKKKQENDIQNLQSDHEAHLILDTTLGQQALAIVLDSSFAKKLIGPRGVYRTCRLPKEKASDLLCTKP